MNIFKNIEDDTEYPSSKDEVDGLLDELILDSESKTVAVFSNGPGWTARDMPKAKDIYLHWGKILVRLNKFDSLFEVTDGKCRICWRCGLLQNHSLERAHILARVDGGSDSVENFHMLCEDCHKVSETLWGSEYWEWFMTKFHKADVEYYTKKAQQMGYKSLLEMYDTLKD